MGENSGPLMDQLMAETLVISKEHSLDYSMASTMADLKDFRLELR